MKTDDDFFDRFVGTVDHEKEGTMWPTNSDMSEIDPYTVWSVIEGEDENMFLLPGFHIVNLVGYVVSELPITPEELSSGEWSEVLWVDQNDYHDAMINRS